MSTRSSALNIRPSTEPPSNASVVTAKAIAREGVRLRGEAAAERAREAGGEEPPAPAHAQPESTRTSAEGLDSPATPSSTVESEGQKARQNAAAPQLLSPGRILLTQIEANGEAPAAPVEQRWFGVDGGAALLGELAKLGADVRYRTALDWRVHSEPGDVATLPSAVYARGVSPSIGSSTRAGRAQRDALAASMPVSITSWMRRFNASRVADKNGQGASLGEAHVSEGNLKRPADGRAFEGLTLAKLLAMHPEPEIAKDVEALAGFADLEFDSKKVRHDGAEFKRMCNAFKLWQSRRGWLSTTRAGASLSRCSKHSSSVNAVPWRAPRGKRSFGVPAAVSEAVAAGAGPDFSCAAGQKRAAKPPNRRGKVSLGRLCVCQWVCR